MAAPILNENFFRPRITPGPALNLNANGIWECLICESNVDCKAGSARYSASRNHNSTKCLAALHAMSEEDRKLAFERAGSLLRVVGYKYFLEKSYENSYRLTELPEEEEEAEEEEEEREPVPAESGQPRPARTSRPTQAESEDAFVGKRVAKRFPAGPRGDMVLYFGNVFSRNRDPVRVGTHLQSVWNVVYDDGDEEQLNKAELLTAIALAIHERRYDVDARTDETEWGEGEDEEEEEEAAPFDSVGPTFRDADPRLWLPLVPGSDRNQFSYLVDLVVDKINKNISTEYLNLRLRRERNAYQSDGPTNWRSVLKRLETGCLQDIVRHRCWNDDCSHAWIGPCDPRVVDTEGECPECQTRRYKKIDGTWKARHFWYLGLDRAIAKMHNDKLWRENFKKNMDISDNAYRQSPDYKRLHEATRGESGLPGSGLYVLYHDGVLPNDTATQSITGDSLSVLWNITPPYICIYASYL